MFIWVNSFIIRYFTPKTISGITIYPFIILENKSLRKDKTFINHEMIHLYQQAELLLFFFLLLYYLEFLILLLKYKNWQHAYRNISFEREAYDNETNYDYLKTRKWFSFIKYW